jgi:hypothetical protein
MTLTLYSPAPATIRMHALNQVLGERLAGAGISNEVVAVALPDAVNNICDLAAPERALHLPIMTSVDLLPAIRKTGPQWHAYNRANADLRLLASLYDVGFGISVFDPVICTPEDLRGRAVYCPPRPSSVRLMTEALLFDGWGLEGQVELVDCRPPDLVPLIADGTLAATSWNLVTLERGTTTSLIPAKLRFLPVDGPVLDRMNAAMAAPLGSCLVDGTPVIAFRQGICVWDETPDDMCRDILDAITQGGAPFFDDPADQKAWPGLSDRHRHPVLLG